MDSQQEQRYGSYLHVLLEISPMLRWIFQHGFKPEREHFSELPAEYLEKAGTFMCGTTDKLFYASSGPLSVLENGNEIALLTENQLNDLFEADAMIERYASKSEQILTTYEEKLRFAAGFMPPELSEETPFTRGSNA